MKVIFVCTGNTCRSPLAESVARHISVEHEFASRGIGAMNGMPVSMHSAEIIQREGLPEVGPAQLFTEEDASVDLILTMSRSHESFIKMQYPNANVMTLKAFATGITGDIADPYGGHFSDYEDVFQQISELVHLAVEKI